MAERWSSNLGFLLASIGAAVGLGNIWRFSAVLGQNGGGAYLVPYLIAAFAFAVPLLVFEFAVGRALRTDVVSAFRGVGVNYTALGWVVAGSVLVILSYYLVLTGWVLGFLVATLLGVDLSFAGFTGTWWPVAAFVVTTVATGGIVSLGVKEGIERLVKVVLPVVFVVIAGLAVYAATLPGFADALAFLFTPDLSVLADPGVWSAAVGQVFFSLSVGQGIMLTYAAYMDENTDLWRSAVVITVADVAIAITAGLVIFPVVFTLGLAPTAGTELAFTTLPRAFASMPGGRAVGVAFFGLLFFAALTSAVSLLEVGVAAATRSFEWSRAKATLALTTGVFLLGVPSALSYGPSGFALGDVPFLDVLDESVGTLALPVTAFLIAVVFTWVAPNDTAERELGRAYPVVKYALPVLLPVLVALKVAGVARPAWSLTVDRLLAGLWTLPGLLVTLAVLGAAGWLLRRRARAPRRRNRRE
ncbi:sodium-dependent transporter [Halocalculus aciditolerans]|uniref:Transporter n=1 Tax=Halocalculus aciditolerans TaxID=1383812 RepID=A0A830FGQ0_9EURY|nr:sodium-dependent transporter [Halocalculus aciditolerans]GGL54035.1 transporter [Halocalculus aciditolerans]